MSDCVICFLLDRVEPFREHLGGSVCDSSCTSLHVSSFVVCGSSVKQVSHSWHIVLDTCALYTFLNFICLFISFLNLYPDSELIIINIVTKNLYSVHRSLEIHNCALTSSPGEAGGGGGGKGENEKKNRTKKKRKKKRKKKKTQKNKMKKMKKMAKQKKMKK